MPNVVWGSGHPAGSPLWGQASPTAANSPATSLPTAGDCHWAVMGLCPSPGPAMCQALTPGQPCARPHSGPAVCQVLAGAGLVLGTLGPGRMGNCSAPGGRGAGPGKGWAPWPGGDHCSRHILAPAARPCPGRQEQAAGARPGRGSATWCHVGPGHGAGPGRRCCGGSAKGRGGEKYCVMSALPHSPPAIGPKTALLPNAKQNCNLISVHDHGPWS